MVAVKSGVISMAREEKTLPRRHSHDILTPTRSTRTTKSPISKKKGNGRKIKMILKILQLKSIREGAGRQSWEDQSKSKIEEAK